MDKNINILVVEDEFIVALDIQNAIKQMGYNCIGIATNYDKVLKAIKNKKPDIILMDINLKNSITGIEIAKKINEKDNFPIIYLTAYIDEKTINNAVETKPVGYIVKPFNIPELKANLLLAIYKISNKNKKVKDEFIQIGEDYYFDKKNEQLFYNEMQIKLTKRERKLLVLLLEARGNIVKFIDIEREIWDDYVTNSALRTLIYRLRSKLDYKLIETIPSYGCKIIIN